MADGCRAFGPWSFGTSAWQDNMAAGVCGRERSSPQTGRRGLVGEKGGRSTPEHHPPSRSHFPKILNPSSTASLASEQTLKP